MSDNHYRPLNSPLYSDEETMGMALECLIEAYTGADLVILGKCW